MKSNLPLIYVVDDDRVLCAQIAQYLGSHGFATACFHDASGLDKALGDKPALILLDVMMPGEDGLAFCRRLRESSRVPVILVSALGEVADKVLGLELGADDYLVKPFSSRELLARIRTLLRRTEEPPPAQNTGTIIRYRFSGWVLEARRRLLIDPTGLVSNLSAAEYRLLRIFLESPQMVLERDTLLRALERPGDPSFDRVLDTQISRLRNRLGESAREQRLIRTSRGDGYLFASDVEREHA